MGDIGTMETMIENLGTDEHKVRVRIPRDEFERVYSERLEKLRSRIHVPGFRPGRTPRALVEKRFGDRAREEAVQEIVDRYYAEAIERSGLSPALRPRIEVPAIQPEGDFEFNLNVVTWPQVELRSTQELHITKTEIEVTGEDVAEVVERLLREPVRFEVEENREARSGDEVVCDLEVAIDGASSETERNADVHLILGSGTFHPQLEDELLGVMAGEEREIEVRIDGKNERSSESSPRTVRFRVRVKSVAAPVRAEDESGLAEMLGFTDVEALRENILAGLRKETERAEWEKNREAVYSALLDTHEISLPEAMVEDEMRRITTRLLAAVEREGGSKTEILEDPALREEVQRRAERNLKISVLMSALRECYEIEVEDAEVQGELERVAAEYPAGERERFLARVRSRKESMDSLRARVLEKKCVDFLLRKATIHRERMSLSEWRRASGADESEKETP